MDTKFLKSLKQVKKAKQDYFIGIRVDFDTKNFLESLSKKTGHSVSAIVKMMIDNVKN